jgi:hypothetical protein
MWSVRAVGDKCHPSRGLVSRSSFVDTQSRADEFDHATRVVAGVVLGPDTEVADAEEQFQRTDIRSNLTTSFRSLG